MALRVALVSDFTPPLGGGMEYHVEGLSRELVSRGHESFWLSPNIGLTWSSAIATGMSKLEDGLARATPLYGDRTFRYIAPIEDPRLVESLAGRLQGIAPDLVHSHGWIAIAAAAACSRTALPHVSTVHDHGYLCPKRTFMKHGRRCATGPGFDCLECSHKTYPVWKTLALLAALRYAGSRWRATRFIAVSDYLRRTYAEFGIDSIANSEVIPNFFWPSPLPPPSASVEAIFRDIRRPIVTFAGALTIEKGVNVLRFLLPALSGRGSLVILTPNQSEVGRDLEDGGAIVVSNARKEFVLSAWRLSDIAIVPSQMPEACPTVLAEAMASGLPVVGWDMGGTPEMVQHGTCGLLTRPLDFQLFTRHVLHLMENETERTRMGRTAEALALARYSANAVIPRILAFYDRGLKGGS